MPSAMIRRLLLRVPQCGCALTGHVPQASPGPAYAERELPLLADGFVRVAIGDPRVAQGLWSRAAIEGSNATIVSVRGWRSV